MATVNGNFSSGSAPVAIFAGVVASGRGFGDATPQQSTEVSGASKPIDWVALVSAIGSAGAQVAGAMNQPPAQAGPTVYQPQPSYIIQAPPQQSKLPGWAIPAAVGVAALLGVGVIAVVARR